MLRYGNNGIEIRATLENGTCKTYKGKHVAPHYIFTDEDGNTVEFDRAGEVLAIIAYGEFNGYGEFKRNELLSEPLVSVEAQDAATDGEFANCARASILAFSEMAIAFNAEIKKVLAAEAEMHRNVELELAIVSTAITPAALDAAINAEIELANTNTDNELDAENIQTEKVKALFNAVKNFDFGSYVNPDMYSLADFVLKLFANIEHAELQKFELNLEQTARAGFKFASVNEQIWANVMQIAHDRAEDDLSYTHVAITHDLYSIGYNRRAIYHFINFLLTQATDTPDRINYFLKKTGSRYTTQDFIININEEVDTDNNTDNNVNNEVIAESAQASGLTFEECMATIAGLTLSEYLAKQEQEEMAFQAHKLKMKIDALKNGILHREANINGNVVTINDILNNHWKPNTNDGYEEWANELAAEIAHDLNKITTLQAQLAKLIPNPETPQTNWVNPHDFTVTGDLSDRNLNGRIIAQRIARELDLERKEMKADGVQYLLIVKTSQLHPFRFHDFKLATASYKSLDALKKLGGSRINDNDWRVETIDGNLIANGNGVDDFNNFFNHKEEVALTDDFNAKLTALKANANDAKANLAEKQAALDKAQEEFLQADATLEDVNRQIIQLGEDKAKELRDTLFTTELLNAPKMTITAQNGNSHLTKLKTLYINFDYCDHNFFITVDKEASVITFKLATYDTTEQVTCAVNLLIDAIKRGDKEFTFPTPDELKPQQQESTDKQINDSLIRAVETNLKNIQAHLQAADNNAFNRELELYQICRKALFRKEVTSCTPTKPVSSANSAA